MTVVHAVKEIKPAQSPSLKLRMKNWKTWRIALLVIVVLCLSFGIYLHSLYVQLQAAFERKDQFVPTRIYSDVARLAPAQLRGEIEDRLSGLGYSPTRSGGNLTFNIHPIDYPSYLVPDDSPGLQSGADGAEKSVTLHFDGHDRKSLLQSLQLAGKEVGEIYLEPEIVATLTRSGGTADGKRQIRDYLEFGQIPSEVWKAIIAIEDQHFLDHRGLDPRGLARAIWVDLRTLSFSQGGSTLTQQLVKNLMARRTKNVFRKVNELFLALILEVKFDKEQILERYLNEVNLGQVGNFEVHGVEEGAQHFFGKRIEELNLGEIALMAGLIRGPYYYSPYRYKDRAMERQRLVLKKMVETHQIAEGEEAAALKLPIRLSPPQSATNRAPYFTDFVKAELIRSLKDKMSAEEITSAGLRVYTTIDLRLNGIAQKSVAEGIADLEKRFNISAPLRLEGALASVDASTGQIKALVGGRNYGQSTFNRILNMRRQVGSTFKPIVYLTAYLKGTDPQGVAYGPGHPAEDGPWKLIFDHGRQNWVPKNYEPGHLGWINYRKALAHSVNTIAAHLGVEVGLANVADTARKLGIESALPLVPSLSLGVAELSPIELLRAYATIANHGTEQELTVIRGITQSNGTGFARFVPRVKEVLPAGPADLLTDTMQNVLTEGTAAGAAAMGFDRPAAGKTGTTSNHRDSWFAGYAPQLTTVVWVGADQDTPSAAADTEEADEASVKTAKKKKKRPQYRLTGANSALPIWVSFMKQALEGDAPAAFPLSAQVTNVKIDTHSGKAATSSCPDNQVIVEKYVVSHEPKDSGCEASYPPSVLETELQ